uniref:Uncharacterized protein n=1 Tax=Glossina pallidipes TaxID=7398 RepID=A0A1A9ZLQ8_GLOPL
MDFHHEMNTTLNASIVKFHMKSVSSSSNQFLISHYPSSGIEDVMLMVGFSNCLDRFANRPLIINQREVLCKLAGYSSEQYVNRFERDPPFIRIDLGYFAKTMTE